MIIIIIIITIFFFNFKEINVEIFFAFLALSWKPNITKNHFLDFSIFEFINTFYHVSLLYNRQTSRSEIAKKKLKILKKKKILANFTRKQDFPDNQTRKKGKRKRKRGRTNLVVRVSQLGWCLCVGSNPVVLMGQIQPNNFAQNPNCEGDNF